MSKDLLITPASSKMDFKNSSGTVEATIELDDNGNLNFLNSNGDLSFGDTTSDIFIGNGVDSVDIVFEQNGEIRPESGRTIFYTGSWKGSNTSANVLSGIPMVVTVERGGVGTANTNMAFGNGSSGDGMRMPYAGKVIAATLGCTSITGSFSAELEVNGSQQASYNLIATGSGSNEGDTQYFSTPYSFSAGDLINFKQVLLPSSQSTAVVSFWIVFD